MNRDTGNAWTDAPWEAQHVGGDGPTYVPVDCLLIDALNARQHNRTPGAASIFGPAVEPGELQMVAAPLIYRRADAQLIALAPEMGAAILRESNGHRAPWGTDACACPTCALAAKLRKINESTRNETSDHE